MGKVYVMKEVLNGYLEHNRLFKLGGKLEYAFAMRA